MDESDEGRLAQLASEFDSLKESPLSQLPFELFDMQSNRTTKLVASSGNPSANIGRNRWFDFTFKEAVLLSKVIVQTEGYSGNKEFEVKWENDLGKTYIESARPTDNVVTIIINDICTSVSFRPPSVQNQQVKIVSVSAEGIERKNIGRVLDLSANLEKYKDEVRGIISKTLADARAKVESAKEIDKSRSEMVREVSTLKGDASRIKKSVDDLSRTQTELIARNSAAKTVLTDIEANISQEQVNQSLLKITVSRLEKEKQKQEVEIGELKANINLFPSEISGFVRQGASNIRQYLFLVIVPIAILVIMMVHLLTGAANLTTVISESSKINIEALLLSRLPYVTVSIAIITVCFKICHAFIVEIFKVNRQRLNLTKLSIIAKDVSAASAHELNLNEDEIFRLRTELKMHLLREHLKDYISMDTVIKLPSQIFGYSVSKVEKDGENL